MSFALYHANNPDFSANPEAIKANTYSLVASGGIASGTDNERMGYIYELSQNIETAWTENMRCRWLLETNHARSTSVGDVICLEGVWYVVAPWGFSEIPSGLVTIV